MGLLASTLAVGGFKAPQGEQRLVDTVSEILVPGAASLLPTRAYHPCARHLLPLLVFFMVAAGLLVMLAGIRITCEAQWLQPSASRLWVAAGSISWACAG